MKLKVLEWLENSEPVLVRAGFYYFKEGVTMTERWSVLSLGDMVHGRVEIPGFFPECGMICTHSFCAKLMVPTITNSKEALCIRGVFFLC